MRFTFGRSLTQCIIFFLFISLAIAATNAPTWSSNTDIKAGTLTITIGGGYGGYFETTYSSSFSSAPNVGVAIPNIDIATAPSLMLWKVNLRQSTNQTHIKINMLYTNNAFKSFKISYLAVIGTLTYLKVDYLELAEASINPLVAGTGTRSITGTKALGITVNSASSLSIIPYLSGLKISSVNGDRGFSLTFAKNNDNSVFWTATCTGSTTVTEIVSYMLFYDITLGEAAQDTFLDYQPITATNNVRNAVTLLYFSQINLLVGASSFSYTNGFSYNIEPTTLALNVPTAGATFTSMTFSFWSFRKRNCIAATPFYEKISNLCYDICPTGFLPVTSTTKYCQSCSTYMAQCTACTSTAVCTACATGWIVNPTNNGCTCAAGYYIISGSCLTCNVDCLTCSGGTSTNCLSCSSTKFLSGTSCINCDPSCATCNGATSSNCLSCKTNAQYLSPTNSCLACVSPCLACSSSATCLSCSDGKYLTASNTCTACDTSCKTCSSSSFSCTSCDTATRTLSGSTCTCKSGVEDADGNCVSLCTDAGCDSCPISNEVCATCKTSFLLSGGRCHCPPNTYYSISDNICSPCSTTCAICSGPSQNECTGCQSSQNREINTNTFACDCKITFYAPNNELTCIKMPSTTCPNNFMYNATSGFCVEICGDGKLFELQCDDGNIDNGDGCDSSCKVESNFICLYGDTQSPSICSYNGQIIFYQIYAEKDMYGNIISLEYKLIPQLKFYQKFPNFTDSLKVSDPTINIVSAVYSSDAKTLRFSVGYNETATGKTVSLSYTPPSSPYSHALVGSSYDWPIRVGNGLSLTFYPQETYNKAKIYDYVALGIQIGSLFVYVLALFFRKMIGVEIIILIQTQILSLSMLNEIHPLLGVLTVDRYAFGYNQFEYLMDLKSTTNYQNVGLYSVIGFSSIFGENVNVMFFAICVFYFLAIVIGLLSVSKQMATGKKLKQAALIIARQIAFGLLLFSLMNMVTSYALQTYAGTIWDYEPEYSGTIKIGSIIVIGANYGVYGLYFKESVESYVFYEKRSRVAQLQPLFIATKAILIAIGIALYQKFGLYVLYGLMGLQGAYILLVIILRPFKRRIDMARSIIVELSLLYVIGSRYVLIEFVNLDKPGGWTMFLEYGFLGEYGLVGFSLLLSLMSLIFHLFKANKVDSQISPEQAYSQFEVEDEKQKEKEKRSTKHSRSTHYPIQDYLENYLAQDDNRFVKEQTNKKKNKLFSDNDLRNNSSLAQLINISDEEGYDSKRKLKQNKMAHSMEIIEMDD